jgi:hypothetical protein
MRNALTRVQEQKAHMVVAVIKTIFAQPDRVHIHRQLDEVADTLRRGFPEVAKLMGEAKADVLVLSSFPMTHWTKIWSPNPRERVNAEIKRGTNVVGIFLRRFGDEAGDRGSRGTARRGEGGGMSLPLRGVPWESSINPSPTSSALKGCHCQAILDGTDVVAMSALLTATMTSMPTTIEAIRNLSSRLRHVLSMRSARAPLAPAC